MVGYISEGIRYFRIAEAHRQTATEDGKSAFVSIVFAAMYLESVVNEAIFTNQLTARLYEEELGRQASAVDIPLDAERIGFERKVALLLENLDVQDYKQADNFIEMKHLMELRGYLVHLKPTEQLSDGTPSRQIGRSALNYLRRSKHIISDPFARGVYWTDVLMRSEVADWAVSVAVAGVDWLFRVTHDDALGNVTFSWHRQLTSGRAGI